MKVVIDTNVLLVANGQHLDVSPECVEECVRRLQGMEKSGITVIDDGFRILGEYQHKTKLHPPKGVGDLFLKSLLRNAGNPARVVQVCLTESTENEFNEFPDPALQAAFDAPDRKFAAVPMLTRTSHPFGRRPTANGWTGGRVCKQKELEWNFCVRPMLASFIARNFQTIPCQSCRFES